MSKMDNDITHDIEQSHRLLDVFQAILLEDRHRYGADLPQHLLVVIAEFTTNSIGALSGIMGSLTAKHGGPTSLQFAKLYRQEFLGLLNDLLDMSEEDNNYGA